MGWNYFLWTSDFIPHYNGWYYSSSLGFKFAHVRKWLVVWITYGTMLWVMICPGYVAQGIKEAVFSPGVLLQTALPHGIGKIKSSTAGFQCAFSNAALFARHGDTWYVGHGEGIIIDYLPFLCKEINNECVVRTRKQTVVYESKTWWRHQVEIFFRVTGPLWGESSGHRRIPLTKASDAELWCFLWSAPGRRVLQTIKTPVIRGAIALFMT